jgi:tRNA (guanine-N7-)-methyltransferase
MTDSTKPLRTVRSFVRREGRMTPSQKKALDELWPQYGIDFLPEDGFVDLAKVFGRAADRHLEIGFGNGDALLHMCQLRPQDDFVGIEVHRPGVGRFMHLAEQSGIKNVRVMTHDAVEVLKTVFAPASFNSVSLFFPDPWHKKRHHKRRIVQPVFVDLVVNILKPGGYFYLATDWENYAEHMLDVLARDKHLQNTSPTDDYCERIEFRPLTRFEKRGERLGHVVRDLIFIKNTE